MPSLAVFKKHAVPIVLLATVSAFQLMDSVVTGTYIVSFMRFAGIPLATAGTIIFVSRIGDVLGVLLSGPMADLCKRRIVAYFAIALTTLLVHDLAKSLGVEKAEVVGHDIGLMVAYAYAAQFPTEVTKLVLMDAFLPGVSGWEAVYNNPGIWHFRFNGPTPEALVQGRERTYFDYFWNDFAADKTHSIPEADRKAYTAAYARPGRMHAGWAYFVSFQQAAKDFAQLSETKLTMPVLTIGGEKSLGEALGQQTKLVATDVTVVVLKDTGHWVLEERPKETTEALQKFL